jgi:hypothetical protein
MDPRECEKQCWILRAFGWFAVLLEPFGGRVALISRCCSAQVRPSNPVGPIHPANVIVIAM